MNKQTRAATEIAIIYGTATVICVIPMLASMFLNELATGCVAVVFGAATLFAGFALYHFIDDWRRE